MAAVVDWATSACYHRGKRGEVQELSSQRSRSGLVTGLAGGFLSGLTGVGGGAIMVPLLRRLQGLSQHRAHGTSLAIVIFSITHLRRENIDLPIVAQVVPGAIVAAIVAGFIADKLDATTLQRIFAVVMVYLYLNTIWSALRRDPALVNEQGG